MLDTQRLSADMRASLLEIGQTLESWPQLASSVALEATCELNSAFNESHLAWIVRLQRRPHCPDPLFRQIALRSTNRRVDCRTSLSASEKEELQNVVTENGGRVRFVDPMNH